MIRRVPRILTLRKVLRGFRVGGIWQARLFPSLAEKTASRFLDDQHRSFDSDHSRERVIYNGACALGLRRIRDDETMPRHQITRGRCTDKQMGP